MQLEQFLELSASKFSIRRDPGPLRHFNWDRLRQGAPSAMAGHICARVCVGCIRGSY